MNPTPPNTAAAAPDALTLAERMHLWDCITKYLGACGVTKVPAYDPARDAAASEVEKAVNAILLVRTLRVQVPKQTWFGEEREHPQRIWSYGGFVHESDPREKNEAISEACEYVRADLAPQAAPAPAGLDAMAEAVHDAYLVTCARLGWGVKPENQVPYSALTEDSKELDRASVRAVLGSLRKENSKAIEKMDAIIERCARKGPGGLWPVGEMKELLAALASLPSVPAPTQPASGYTVEWECEVCDHHGKCPEAEMPADCDHCDKERRIGKIKMISARPAPTQPTPDVCEWYEDDPDCDSWQTGCKKEFSVTYGQPSKDGWKYCHGCGKPINVTTRKDLEEDGEA